MLRKHIEAIPLTPSLLVTSIVVLIGVLIWLNQTLTPQPTVSRPLEIGALDVAGQTTSGAAGDTATTDPAAGGAAPRQDLQAATRQYRAAYEVVAPGSQRALQAASQQYRAAYDGPDHLALQASTTTVPGADPYWGCYVAPCAGYAAIGAATTQYRAAYDSTAAGAP